MSVEPRPARWAWLFVLPAVIAVAALAWAVLYPRVVCTSGSDAHVCTDYRNLKLFVATAGVGLAVLITALLAFAIRRRRGTMAAGVAVGGAVTGLAGVSYLRAII